ncbi:MAG: aspartate aminotransferase family protein [Deltaproteobacteria bacterium]|jgi:acetylornithine aminotransferase/acetylornithine/N-succinyldiaminopimelate aminotransferase|nr:aspartate aminotransferase family protein [Deltaproteobacteria bacterium]
MNRGNSSWIERSNRVFMPTYNRFPAVLVKGAGCELEDADGRKYLDFLAGIAVCSLGHCHPEVTEAICRQAARLVHVSNLFHTQPQTELAEILVARSFADCVFFGNSGAEANEAAIKLARKYSGEGRFEIISLAGSFHGRTMATVAATGQPKFHQGFEPLPAGFRHAAFGDIGALEKLISPQTCAILCEPLQGESGVRPLDRSYLAEIRQLCDDNGLLLIFDEVQTGIGRTGTLFAYEQLGVVPDILTSAKALANGLPMGAMLTTGRICAAFGVGSHASTFGGNPVAAAAAVAVLNVMLAEGFLAEVRSKGEYLAATLAGLAAKYPGLASGTRGLGLLQGLVLTEAGVGQGQHIVNMLFDRGVLINFAGNAVLRFIPPLVVSRAQIDSLAASLDAVFSELA